MKKAILLIMVVFSVLCVHAQTGSKPMKKKAVTPKPSTVETTRHKETIQQESVSLNAVSNNQAHANTDMSSFTISDPTIRALNQRAAGYDVPLGPSGILGMPKRKYGFASGKLLLRSTTAPSSGTNYGSGAVGTGTSIMGVGTGEGAIGVNGKNPYAGPWLWGGKLPTETPVLRDSIRNR
jgi:hypothetical protein